MRKTPGTRPTMNRVKENVFNILNNINGKSFLDLFAGSGAVGLEAYSRGASKVVLIDSDKEAIDIINKNIIKLNIKENVFVFKRDYSIYLDDIKNKEKFDYIYCDPPYDLLDYDELLEYISHINIVREGGYLIVETDSELSLKDSYGQLKLQKMKKYGSNKIWFFRIDL